MCRVFGHNAQKAMVSLGFGEQGTPQIGVDHRLEAVREQYCAGELVLFVGAGVSQAAGLPGWAGLVEQLGQHVTNLGKLERITEIQDCINQKDFAQALTVLKKVLGREDFHDLVRKKLNDRTVKELPSVLCAIATLEPELRAVLTTNLDHLLERAFEARFPSLRPGAADIGQGKGYILKLHGTLHEPRTWILTKADYELALYDGQPPYPYADDIRSIFHARTLLFVGYGLADYDFNQVLAKLSVQSRGTPPKHYALMLRTELSQGRLEELREAGVNVIPYDSHDSLPEILRSISAPRGSSIPPRNTHSSAPPQSGVTLRAYTELPEIPAEVEVRTASQVDPGAPLAHHAGQLKPWLWSLAVLLLVLFITGATMLSSPGSWQKPARDRCDYAQLCGVLVICLLGVPWGRRRELRAGDAAVQDAAASVAAFERRWRGLWATWVVFYLGHSVRHYLDTEARIDNPVWGAGWEAFFVSLQFVQVWNLLGLFWSMFGPTLPKGKPGRYTAFELIPLFAVLVGVGVSPLLVGVRISIFWASLVVGISGAAALMRFIGRLESTFLAVHPIELFLLSIYAGLQPLFRMLGWLESDPKLLAGYGNSVYLADLILRALAFAFKVGLFFTVRRQLESGRLAFYMSSVRTLAEATRSTWRDFQASFEK